MKRLLKRKYLWQSPGWPHFTWNAETLLPLVGAARAEQTRLLTRLEHLTLKPTQETRAEVLVEEALKTSAIEGEHLNPASVRSSVAKRLGLPAQAGATEERGADGLIEVLLDATQNHSTPLTADRLKGWQAALFPTGYSGITKLKIGHWRGDEPMRVVSGPLGRERVHYEAPPGTQLEQEMKLFLSWWKTSAGSIDGLIRAGIAHFYFVAIHPFEDGNGRIARALTDMALAQDERQAIRYYSLSSQIMTERKRYYAVLEETSTGSGDLTGWLVWFLECYRRAVKNSEILVQNVLLKARFWQVHQMTALTQRQQKVVNRLLNAGPGEFTGGLTTRKYVAMTKASRATAFREIADLVKKGFLKANPSQGRSASYDLVWK